MSLLVASALGAAYVGGVIGLHRLNVWRQRSAAGYFRTLTWLDEPAHWPLIQECWDYLMFGMRLGARPRIVCTTTPKSRPWLKELSAEPSTRITSVSTYTNIENLSPVFAERVIKKYEGSRRSTPAASANSSPGRSSLRCSSLSSSGPTIRRPTEGGIITTEPRRTENGRSFEGSS